QNDWPNPQRSTTRVFDHINQNTKQIPYDFVLRSPINVRVASIDMRSALSSTSLGSSPILFSVVRPFLQSDWPNPQKSRFAVYDFIDPSEFWQLKDQMYGPAGMVPDYDWTNPQRQRPLVSYHISSSDFKLLKDQIYGAAGQ